MAKRLELLLSHTLLIIALASISNNYLFGMHVKCRSLAKIRSDTSSTFNANTAVYKGLITSDLSPSPDKGELIINNLFTGNQDHYPINVNSDGSFFVHVPIYYPVECFIKFSNFLCTVYLEPGKTLTHNINVNDKVHPNIFQGDCAIVNQELEKIKSIRHFSNEQLNVLAKEKYDLKYLEAVLRLKSEKLAALDSFRSLNALSQACYKLAKLDIQYRVAYEILIHQDGNVTSSSHPYFDDLDFTEAAFTSNEFNRFLSYLKYSRPLLQQYYKDILFKKIYPKLYANKSRTAEENDVFKLLTKAKDSVNLSFTAKLVSDSYKAVFNKYGRGSNDDNFYLGAEVRNIRKEYLKTITHRDITVASDLLFLQDQLQTIAHTYKPLSNSKLKAIKGSLSSTFLRVVLNDFNCKIECEIYRNKAKSGYILNTLPNVSKKQVFAEILNEHKGNVLLIDFWATWCMPCIAGMEKMGPLKKRLENDKVVFVYITNTTSPFETYRNAASNLKGQYYRLNKAQWKILCDRFNIIGIPHYLIVDKAGTLIDSNAQVNDTETLFKELLRLSRLGR